MEPSPGYPPGDTLKEPTQENDRATQASPSKAYPTDLGGPYRMEEKSIVKEKTIYLLINPVTEANLRYAGDKRSDTDENRRGKRYRQKKKGYSKILWRKI